MKLKAIFLCLAILLFSATTYAHTLFLSLSDEGDNVIELEGMYSTGETAVKTPVTIYSSKTGKVLWRGETDDLGICSFTRPSEPYEVELNAGPGHQVKEEGI